MFIVVADANMKLKLGSGILIAAPIPKEHAASGSLIESAIQSALREARSELVSAYENIPSGFICFSISLYTLLHNCFYFILKCC